MGLKSAPCGSGPCSWSRSWRRGDGSTRACWSSSGRNGRRMVPPGGRKPPSSCVSLQPCDPLQPEPAQKSQSLLSRWREKVFALMVQLRSQELGHADATNLLQRKVSELQGEVESRDQKVALLLHSLQDKTAEADMERVNNKRLRAELSHQEDSGQRLQRRAEAAEGSLWGLVEIVSRLHQQVGGQEAELKAAALNLAGLGNQVTFAAKRVDTIQGLVSRKVALARLQRDEQPKAAGSENDGGSTQEMPLWALAGYLAMLPPPLEVALDAAEKAAHEAQDAVNRHTNEASRYSAEVCRYEEQERQVEAEIAANEPRLAQIDAEQRALAVLQEEIVTLQDGLRKCVTFMNGLAGKVCVAKRLTEDLLIYEELANSLGEVVQHMLPTMSLGGEAGTRFLAAGELQGLIEKLKSGGCSLRALADAEAAAIDY
ncbi:coiled-coil alpha-helical rod protein 1-like [Mauremys mutica]|uniref:coiled-coil alpha-helical rod protein 1-like n=1 Tax=Mauremys mutica TaxID=74926 RepID=UPI001D1633EC|nr:coiled-coil alpha-helical rod protein 1-like [Mauremys mutica]